MSGRDVVEGVLAPGPRGPVDRVFQRAGDRAVELGSDEQHRVADRAMASFRAVASGDSSRRGPVVSGRSSMGIR